MDDHIVSSIYALGTAFVYCIPTFITLGRGIPIAFLLLIVNLSLGWAVIGWIGALVWALNRETANPDMSKGK